MKEEKLEDLSAEEFQGLMEGMLSDEFDKVTMTEFFGALAAMDEAEQEVVELNAHVDAGQLVIEQPATLPVRGNEIRVDNKRIIIRMHEKAA